MDQYEMEIVKQETKTNDFKSTVKEEDKLIEDIKIEILQSSDDDKHKLSNADTEEFQLSNDDSNSDSEQKTIQHICKNCCKPFWRSQSLQKHLEFCRFNSNYHLRKAEMLKNLEKIEKDSIIMEKKDVCFCCGESRETCHVGHITCPDCTKSFKTQISYERHAFLTHSEFDDYPCSICNAKLRSANLLILHEQQHRIRGRPYVCKLCGKDFIRPYDLVAHQKYTSCSASNGENGESVSCKVCNRVFKRKDHLKNHLKRHLTNELRTTEKKYVCTICKKRYRCRAMLTIHIRTHTGEKPFNCDLCEKKFISLGGLKNHRSSHTSDRPYTCLLCKRSFTTKLTLQRHIKRHTGERPYECDECSKSFITPVELRSHKKTHFRPYECNECPEKFRTERQLARHVKDHDTVEQESDEAQNRKRTHLGRKCGICKIKFKTDLEFESHMKKNIHATPAKHPRRKTRTDCPVCNLNFYTAQTLQFHIQTFHKEDPETFLNENSVHTEEHNNKTDIHLIASPNIIKIEDSPTNRIEFVTNTTANNTNIHSLKQQKTYKTSNNIAEEKNKVKTLGDNAMEKNLIKSANGSKGTIFLDNKEFTITSLDSDGDIVESVTTGTISNIPSSDSNKIRQKALAKSLAAAIADGDDIKENKEKKETFSEEDLKIKDKVSKLLIMLVDSITLKKFGWPNATEEIVLCKVIQNCGHDLTKDQQNYSKYDYANRMREYVKLLLTVVIHDDSIKKLLNDHGIDEVIECVLDDYDDDDENDKNIKRERTYSS